MAEYHVGRGIAGIYAGTLNKKGDMWVNKSDVTDEVLNCAFEYLYINEKEFRATINDVEYAMRIVPITEPQERSDKEQDIKEEIKVGDEVEWLICGGGKKVITNIDRGEYRLMDAYGNISYADGLKYYKRTGRTFPQMAEILKQLRGDKDAD